MHVQRLDWDSEFFGFPIGRLVFGEGDESAVTADVQAAVDEARAAGIECVYASVDPTHRGLVIAISHSGFLMVEVAMDLVHRTSIIEHLPQTRSMARFGTVDDLPALEEEISLMAPWSRYAMDPRFGEEAARRMHRAWVERAVGPEPHRRLVVAEDEDGISGFSTMTELPDQEPRIDLIASSRPGSGAAYALVDFAYGHFGERRSWGGPIAARNVASLRFCENMGLHVGRVAYHYHLWLT